MTPSSQGPAAQGPQPSVTNLTVTTLPAGRTTKALSEQGMLIKLNEQLAQLGFNKGDLLEVTDLPELPSQVKAMLAGKSIVMIDDQSTYIQRWLPTLQVASAGCADFIHHTADITPEAIMSLLVEKQPDIILLDSRLAGGLNGVSLIKQIQDIFPNAAIAAISSSQSLREEMLNAGADFDLPKAAIDITEADFSQRMARGFRQTLGGGFG